MKINYIIGDATNPQGPGNKIIVHCCNNIGGWGRGFVVALSKKWKEPEANYREWYNKKEWTQDCPNGTETIRFELGEVQFVDVDHLTKVANLIGQKGIAFGPEGPPVRYEEIKKGFLKIKNYILNTKSTANIHMPRIGCGLAGGSWQKIYDIIKEVFEDTDIQINIYTLPHEEKDYPNIF
jgi:O-acetyl-ADP-ribose deacetylase (regulator of RNase III)